MEIPPSIAKLPGSAGELSMLLAGWCDQNSGSNNPAGLAGMLQLLKREFSRLPGEVDSVLLRPSSSFPFQLRKTKDPLAALRVRVRPQAAIQLFFNGHYDTVYDANDSFQHCELISPEKLRGPGVIDMKGGLVVMHAALEAFERTHHAGNIGYEVLLTPDEETGSFHSAKLLAEAAASHQFGFVFEPARPRGDLVQSRKGTANFTITCHGRAAHAASAARDGRNAIAALAGFLTAADRLPEEVPGVLLNIGNIKGGAHATNVVPDFAEAQLDVRITHATDREVVLFRLGELAAGVNAREGYKLEITGGFNRPPMEASPQAAVVFSHWQQCGLDLGLATFSWVHAGGGSDANLLSAAGLPCLDGLGPSGDRLHSPEEWVHLPSLVERAQVAALFLHRLAEGNISLPSRS
jgi:glutamate carboxypeptidase